MEAQKRPKNVIFISGGAYLGPESEKKCSPLSSIFDVVAPFQRYLPKSEIGDFGRFPPQKGNILMKFGQMVRVTKKMTMTYNRAKPQSRNGETAVFGLGPKSQNGPKIHFLPNKVEQW